MIVYATPDDLTDWSPALTLPANIAQILRSASLLVAMSLDESLYAPGAATTPERRDATCAQAASWIASTIDPTAGPAALTGKVKSKTVENVSLTYDIPSAATRAEALTMLCADAYNILYSAGLLHLDLPIWSGVPDPGLFVDELGNVSGSYYGPALAERPYGIGW